MAEYDDDEHRAAYERARDYAEFASIVQHYDDTARGNHDDIDYDAPDHDGTEYDYDGEPVLLIGITGPLNNDIFVVLDSVVDAIIEFGSFDDIPDDYDFLPATPYETDPDDLPTDDCGHRPADHRIWRCEFDIYNNDLGGLDP